jgi:hypothetical protein
MRTLKKLALATVLMAIAYPAQAGEITGNGKAIDINARSECAFSGINDTPQGGGPDPGGKVQSYGYLVGHWDLIDPSEWDPNGDPFQRIPGFACNPNRWTDLHADE